MGGAPRMRSQDVCLGSYDAVFRENRANCQFALPFPQEGKMNRRAIIVVALVALIAAAYSTRISAIEPARLTLEDLTRVEALQATSLSLVGKWFALSWQGQ